LFFTVAARFADARRHASPNPARPARYNHFMQQSTSYRVPSIALFSAGAASAAAASAA